MRQSSVPPAVARSILVTVCSPHGGDVVSYGAGRVTDARRRSQVCELAAAGDRPLIDANMLGRSNAQAPRAFV